MQDRNKHTVKPNNLLPRCAICEDVPVKGIAGGMKIRRAFICNQCEQKIVTMDVESQEYHAMVSTIKNILGF
ncbi:MAG TPA: hypothetical protein GX404_09860 [Syntrophomonadaceae bacterium]|jgi:hypothetical protein|nr:hypothetical protein [Syntrophomonadaceae bacterium]